VQIFSMPTSPPRPDAPAPSRLTDRKREAIIAAAIDAFRQQGFAGTSMDAVASGAQVSKRTVYNHFPSKDDLFAEILRQLFERSHAVAGLDYSATRPLRAQLRELLLQKMALLDDASFMNLSRVGLAEVIHAPERAQAILERLGEKEEGLATWLRAAQADGRLRPGDPAHAAQLLQGMVKAFAFWPQLTLGQPPLPVRERTRVVDDCVDMFLAHHAVPAPSRPAPP
jgi:TetR/AcrR family transcriptional regulator of autoinduction and epiphytic fitness